MFYKKTDTIIIAVIIIFAAVLNIGINRLTEDKQVQAEIYHYSALVMTVELNNNTQKSFCIPQNDNVIFTVSDGTIRFEQSDGPDKLCVNTGKLGKSGQTAACLPNGIVVKLVPVREREDYPDATTGR